MKILFLVRHPLYLRNFEFVLRELAAKGHRIELVFSPLAKEVDRTLVDALVADHPDQIVERALVPRTGWWWPVSDGFRIMRDYLRYLDPAYAAAPALAARGARRVPDRIRALFERVPVVSSGWVRALAAFKFRMIDGHLPVDPGLEAFIRRAAPDLVMVTPLIDFLYGQMDAVKAAKALGIPTLLLVASWDNLTNKGLVQVPPDRTVVWNDIQVREAVEMHGLARSSVIATGAQLFDNWFERDVSTDRAGFCARVGGLDPDRAIILYLCSSTFICPDEVAFVRRWLTALRGSGDPNLAEANVIIRPHPAHFAQWRGVDLSAFGRVRVWPDGNGVPVDDERKRDYFDSLSFAEAVVGINTSGFIEAGIVGRRTLTIQDPEFARTQEGTLHFHYLTEGGLLTSAETMAAHLSQLVETLADPAAAEAQVRSFIESFVRPHGLDQPATPRVVAAIEETAALTPRPVRPGMLSALVRNLIRLPSRVLRRMMLERVQGDAETAVERLEIPRVAAPVGRSTGHSAARVQGLMRATDRAFTAAAAASDPIVIGPWMGGVASELLYWLPLIRWGQRAYGIDPDRCVIAARDGAGLWYSGLAGRVIDLSEMLAPDERAALDAALVDDAGFRRLPADRERDIAAGVARHAGFGGFHRLGPDVLIDGVFRFHGTGRSPLDHLLAHAVFERLDVLPAEPMQAGYQAVGGALPTEMLERLRAGGEVVEVWGSGTADRSLAAATRLLSGARSFIGTDPDLAVLAGFLGRPAVLIDDGTEGLSDIDAMTARTVLEALGVPFVRLKPAELDLARTLF